MAISLPKEAFWAQVFCFCPLLLFCYWYRLAHCQPWPASTHSQYLGMAWGVPWAKKLSQKRKWMMPYVFREKNISRSVGMTHTGSLACRASLWLEQRYLPRHPSPGTNIIVGTSPFCSQSCLSEAPLLRHKGKSSTPSDLCERGTSWCQEHPVSEVLLNQVGGFWVSAVSPQLLGDEASSGWAGWASPWRTGLSYCPWLWVLTQQRRGMWGGKRQQGGKAKINPTKPNKNVFSSSQEKKDWKWHQVSSHWFSFVITII